MIANNAENTMVFIELILKAFSFECFNASLLISYIIPGSSLLHMDKFDRYSPGMILFCCSTLFEGLNDR